MATLPLIRQVAGKEGHRAAPVCQRQQAVHDLTTALSIQRQYELYAERTLCARQG